MTEHETDTLSLAQIDAELENCFGRGDWSFDEGRDLADDQASRLRALVGDGRHDDSHEALSSDCFSQVALSNRPMMVPRSARRTRNAFVLTIASGKGGVGKTSIAVNLAVALASQRWRVCLLDADLGTANADVLCGLNPAARLEHVLTGLPVHDGARRSILDIAMEAPGGFRLIAGASGIAHLADMDDRQRARLFDVLTQLEEDADIIIVDAAAGVGGTVTSLLNASDLGIVVATPEPTSIADAYALMKCAYAGAPEGAWRTPSLLVNQAIDHAEAQSVYGRIAAVSHRFLAFRPADLGWIAQDLRMAEAVRARRPVLLGAPSCRASRQIREVALRVAQQVGERRRAPDPTSAERGLRALLRRWRSAPAPVPQSSAG